jgi:hypothetical protein
MQAKIKRKLSDLHYQRPRWAKTAPEFEPDFMERFG